MSWKETSQRIDEVVGGEIFNPWQVRRFLPSQFEKHCLEDPEFKGLIPHPWIWTERAQSVIRQLSENEATKSIAEERKAFYPGILIFSKTDRKVYNALISLYSEPMYTGIYKDATNIIRHGKGYARPVNSVNDVRAKQCQEIISAIQLDKEATIDCLRDAVWRKPALENYPNYAEYQHDNCLWGLRLYMTKHADKFDKPSWAKLSENLTKAVEAKEMYAKEGIYYYKRSKGENPDLSKVLGMSWDEVISFRKGVRDVILKKAKECASERKKALDVKTTESLSFFDLPGKD